jgi:sulfur-oxidizing protein SoxB
VGGLAYACDPLAKIGSRISDLRLQGKPLEAGKRYKVAGWAPVAEGGGAGNTGEPVWDVVERYLRDRKTVAARAPNLPRLIGVQGNPGLA